MSRMPPRTANCPRAETCAHVLVSGLRRAAGAASRDPAASPRFSTIASCLSASGARDLRPSRLARVSTTIFAPFFAAEPLHDAEPLGGSFRIGQSRLRPARHPPPGKRARPETSGAIRCAAPPAGAHPGTRSTRALFACPRDDRREKRLRRLDHMLEHDIGASTQFPQLRSHRRGAGDVIENVSTSSTGASSRAKPERGASRGAEGIVDAAGTARTRWIEVQ